MLTHFDRFAHPLLLNRHIEKALLSGARNCLQTRHGF
ncbi:hypothetical protein GQ607_012191 [Colletotrichum asianum]|uniref:Uncharacterized protein n=1 Tax=Colletotrichum asianum TaxID=702518 RepID=A0A8H3W6A3_9PEZI|nr:hypothetical protein GQ607_012191 [Colletotrichum asianum]